MTMHRSDGHVTETLTVDLTIHGTDEYLYLDSGNGRRLEQFGPYRLIRPCPIALWLPEQPVLWAAADAEYTRGTRGDGQWTFHRSLPSRWTIRWQGLDLEIKPTGFGHVGLFPEHAVHWPWLTHGLNDPRPTGPVQLLHLFAYTGAVTLAAARAGAQVCHLDAVADIIGWARRNAVASTLNDRPVRWICDDVMKFTAREIRRKRRYDGIILDPPSYGKGPAGERWILEEHLPELLNRLPALLSDTPRLLLFTCHSTAFSPALMRTLLTDFTVAMGGQLRSGTMLLGHPQRQRQLPSGFYAAWSPSKSAATTV